MSIVPHFLEPESTIFGREGADREDVLIRSDRQPDDTTTISNTFIPLECVFEDDLKLETETINTL